LQRGLVVRTTGAAGGDLRLVRAESDGFEQRLAIAYSGKTSAIRLPLLGTYQATNALVAAALAMACGIASDTAIAALEHLDGVKGRLEVVGRHNGGIAVVDYAHKPEALEAALDALRPFASGRIITVFGCGGDRDRGKRPVMGGIAARKSDVVIITDDNPRSEDPAAIRAEVMTGARGAREIGDRAAAIAEGVRLLGPGDVLLVAGKGHESGQIVGAVTTPFLDHDAVAAAIAGRRYRPLAEPS
jgi:UDP-N-acetylmuramoyl-L-alanyl-D-glutamate--2,6-diaminopimelate ligase